MSTSTSPTTALPSPADLSAVATLSQSLREEIGRVVSGMTEAVDTLLTVVFARGNLLIEDVPGVGKTSLVQAFARATDCQVSRIQFTPDLLPSDVTGVSVYRPNTQEFTFRRGPVFANVVIADEINRTSPKTQSALLEAMQEGAVTVDGITHPLPSPFVVVATQNPIEMEGTYVLPEAQRDRFMAQVSVGYPSAAHEVRMLAQHGSGTPLKDINPIASAEDIARISRIAQAVFVSASIRQYLVDVAHGTRNHEAVQLGVSPRATLQLQAAAKARAAMEGRDHVLPDDVKVLAPSVLGHRVVLSREGRLNGANTASVISDVLRRTMIPPAL